MVDIDAQAGIGLRIDRRYVQELSRVPRDFSAVTTDEYIYLLAISEELSDDVGIQDTFQALSAVQYRDAESRCFALVEQLKIDRAHVSFGLFTGLFID